MRINKERRCADSFGMEAFIALICLFVVAVVLESRRRRQPEPVRATSAPASYVRARALFTPAERSFLGVLDQATKNQYRIFGKVRLADVLQTKPGLSASARMAAFNRIAKLHVDFVLCDPQTLYILAVVELDDRSHARPNRQQRDAFVDAAFAGAGVPVLHVPCRAAYTVADIAGQLDAALTAHFSSRRAA